jgi:hypothetical protein
MNKNLIRLTEGDLHRIVKKSVNSVLNEGFGDNSMMNKFVQPNPQAKQQWLQQRQQMQLPQQQSQQSFETQFPMTARQLQKPENTLDVGKYIQQMQNILNRFNKYYDIHLKTGRPLYQDDNLINMVKMMQDTLNQINGELS